MREALGGSTPVVMTMAQLMGNLANVSRSDQKLSISLATIATIDNESFTTTTTTTREKKGEAIFQFIAVGESDTKKVAITNSKVNWPSRDWLGIPIMAK